MHVGKMGKSSDLWIVPSACYNIWLNGNNMVEGSPNEWLYDYTLQFLASPGWKIPILSFIDDKCYAFNNEEENRFEHTTIHNVKTYLGIPRNG